MRKYIKPFIETLRIPELMQGFYQESTPEEQLGKSVIIDDYDDWEDDYDDWEKYKSSRKKHL